MLMMLGLWLSRRAAVVEPGRADAHDAGLHHRRLQRCATNRQQQSQHHEQQLGTKRQAQGQHHEHQLGRADAHDAGLVVVS